MIFGKGAKIGKRQSFQQIVMGKLDIHMQKNEIRPLLSTKIKKLTQNVPKT